MKNGLEGLVQGALERLGFRIAPWRPGRYPGSEDDVTNSFELDRAYRSVPGMVSTQNGFKLYLLSMAQQLSGDVIEIGSWMGRSTCFLARACRDRGDSRVFAVDHFKGNPGKEAQYGLDEIGPDDIREAFWSNLGAHGLEDHVTLYDAPSTEAVKEIRAASHGIRLVFIDGDHRYPGVSTDLELYSALLDPEGLLILDDYARAFPGVVQAAHEQVIGSDGWSHAVQWENMLMVRKLPR